MIWKPSVRAIRHVVHLPLRHGDVSMTLADQAIISGSNFVVSILLARYLGAEEFGKYYIAWVFVLFAAALQFTIVAQPMMSIGPKEVVSSQRAYFGAVFGQQLVTVAAVFVLLYAGFLVVGIVLGNPKLSDVALPVAVVAGAFLMQEFVRRFAFTRQHSRIAIRLDTVAYLTQLVLILAWRYTFGLNADTVLWLIAGAFGLSFLAGLPYLSRGVAWDPHILGSVAARHWRFYKWLVPANLLMWVTNFASLLIAGTLLGVSAVGGLRAGYLLVGAAHVLLMGLENFVPVQASIRLSERGMAAMVSFLLRVSLIGGALLAAGGIIVAVAPSFWMSLIFGDGFAEYAEVLRWYAIFLIIAFPALPLRAGLRALEQTRPILFCYGLSAATSLVLAYPLIRTFGLIGVPIGGIIVAILDTTALFVLFARRVHGRQLRRA